MMHPTATVAQTTERDRRADWRTERLSAYAYFHGYVVKTLQLMASGDYTAERTLQKLQAAVRDLDATLAVTR